MFSCISLNTDVAFLRKAGNVFFQAWYIDSTCGFVLPSDPISLNDRHIKFVQFSLILGGLG